LPLAESMLFGNQPFIADMTAHAVAQPPLAAKKMREAFKRRAEIIIRRCRPLRPLSAIARRQECSCLADVRGTGLSGEEFALRLLEEEHVAVMPGEAFGEQINGFVRISLTVPDEDIRQACDAFAGSRQGLGPDKMTFKTVGEHLVELLEARGVDTVFGIPGVHTIELYRGLGASNIRHITPRHEQGAGFMADGYARASGKPGVAFVITGPGLTNTITAMAQARLDSVPMLVISGVNRRDTLGKNLGFLHELPDQQSLAAEASLWSQTILTPEELEPALARAFADFATKRPGPIHIEVPTDVMKLPASGNNREKQNACSHRRLPKRQSGKPARFCLQAGDRSLLQAGARAMRQPKYEHWRNCLTHQWSRQSMRGVLHTNIP
jgi:hypothetical protein